MTLLCSAFDELRLHICMQVYIATCRQFYYELQILHLFQVFTMKIESKKTLKPPMCQNSETEIVYDQGESLNKTNNAESVSNFNALKTIAR